MIGYIYIYKRESYIYENVKGDNYDITKYWSQKNKFYIK